MSETYLGENTPKLGFGLMRLPMKGEEIDIPQLCKMVDTFLANGFTYFDTAFGYHNGESEKAAGKALVARHPRNTYTLATKLPAWMIKTREDRQKVFDEQLKRTGAGYFDFYLLHAIGAENLKTYDDLDCWAFIQEKKAAGLVRHIGFSFHDSPELLDQILTKHPEVEFVQLQINYADWDSDSVRSRECYETCRKHQKPVVIMEPVKGGTLASLAPAQEELLKSAAPDQSIASWAVRFCASLPGLITILSGMSNEDQMADNLKTMAAYKPFSTEERQTLDQVITAMKAVKTVPCTGCSYCTEGCPMSIHIPDLIRAYNHTKVYGLGLDPEGRYTNAVKDGGKASACVACGQCEGVCPQKIPVISVLKEIAETFE